MQAALEYLSKEDLLKVISSRDQALSEQQRMVDSLKHDSIPVAEIHAGKHHDHQP